MAFVVCRREKKRDILLLLSRTLPRSHIRNRNATPNPVLHKQLGCSLHCSGASHGNSFPVSARNGREDLVDDHNSFGNDRVYDCGS